MFFDGKPIEQDIAEAWRDDMAFYNESMQTRGLWYHFGLLCMTVLCCVKSVAMFIDNKMLEVPLKEMTPREQLRIKLTNHDVQFDESLLDIVEDENIKIIGDVLRSSDGVLRGETLKVTIPKVTEQDLILYREKHELTQPLVIKRVTFGNTLNLAIKKVFGDKVRHRKMKGSSKTYLVFEDSELIELKQNLEKMYNISNVRIRLTKV